MHLTTTFFKSGDSITTPVISPDSIEYILAHDSTHLIIDTWRWYAEGYRYPVLETITNRAYNSGSDKEHFSTSFYYPPVEQCYLSKYQNKCKSPINKNTLKKYRRQYVGFLTKDNDIIIWINFINNKSISDKESSEDVIRVFDGGSNYWSIFVNLTKKTS